MNSTAFSLILFSAIMHSLWNFFTKRTLINRVAMLWLGWLLAGLAVLPIAIYYTDLAKFTWHWVYLILLTGFFHALYLFALGWAYSMGDMSMVYPISRGIAIVCTISIMLGLNLEQISKFGAFGIFLISVGIMLVALKKAKDLNSKLAVTSACLVGLCTTGYVIVDKFSLQHMPPLFYICSIFLSTTILMFPIMVRRLRPQLEIVIKRHKLFSFSIGAVTLITYLMILYAMTIAPTSYVVALREISIVFGSILGMWILGEERTIRKIVGIIIIFIGTIILKLA